VGDREHGERANLADLIGKSGFVILVGFENAGVSRSTRARAGASGSSSRPAAASSAGVASRIRAEPPSPRDASVATAVASAIAATMAARIELRIGPHRRERR
jgi:hypothetical protein